MPTGSLNGKICYRTLTDVKVKTRGKTDTMSGIFSPHSYKYSHHNSGSMRLSRWHLGL